MARLKKKLPNDANTKKYLDTLPRVYLIAVWARAGVLSFPFPGKFDKKTRAPLVYDYDDKNGTEDSWYLRHIDFTTTGVILGWAADRTTAQEWAEEYNIKHGL